MGIIDDLRKSASGALSRWARQSDDDVSFEDMQKALQNTGLADPTALTPRAMFHDPYSITDWGGWRQRPSALTYDTLLQLSMTCAPIAAILQLRINQMSRFARPQQGPYDAGYSIKLRDRRDRNKSMTKVEQRRAAELERMLETTGWLMPDEKPVDRDSFRGFLKKSTRDILTYDQWVYEIIRDRRQRPSRFICLPAETIRPAVADIEHMSPMQRRDRVAYVQVFENTVIAEFAQDDVAWNIMNPRSDMRVNGFGLSPIEMLIRLVTSWLFGFEYNSKFFTQGSAIKGLINVKGAIPDQQMRAFRRQWYAMVAGINNAWRTPILNSEDVQWINMHSTNREMEFSAWMDWLTKLICAVYGVDPVEINFQFGNTGQKSALAQQGQEEKIVESKDKGLRPIFEHVSDSINRHLIWELEPDFEFSFFGLDAKAEETDREARIKEVAAFKTVDEVRGEMDLPPLPQGLGAVILNPTWLQFTAQQQQAQMGGAPGGEMPPGADGSQGDAGDTGDNLLSQDVGDGNQTSPSHEYDDPDDMLHHGTEAHAAKHAAADDEDDEDASTLLHHGKVLKRAQDLEAFAVERLQKASVTRVVKDNIQSIDIDLGS